MTQRRLTPEERSFIRQEVARGVTHAFLARKLGVSHSAVGKVVRGESYKSDTHDVSAK